MMFRSVGEKTTVAVLTAIVLGILGIVWTYANRVAGEIAGAMVLPQGAIVAFEGECPSPQWLPYRKATSRFLIGAGTEADFESSLRGYQQLDGTGSGATNLVPLAVHDVGQHGGEAAHVLSIPELPSHSHPQTWGQGAGDKDVPQSGESVRYLNRAEIGQTLSVGGGQAHNNMPPYLAVRFCVKS
jgi:hypothetical protein